MRVATSQVLGNTWKAQSSAGHPADCHCCQYADRGHSCRSQRAQGQLPPFKASFIYLPTKHTSREHKGYGKEQAPRPSLAAWLQAAEADVNQ